MDQYTHIIPLGRPEPIHSANSSCWCHPVERDNGAIFIHNAKDCREKWERQGIIEQDKPWCLVYEGMPNT
jgi:hypothetical protein